MVQSYLGYKYKLMEYAKTHMNYFNLLGGILIILLLFTKQSAYSQNFYIESKIESYEVVDSSQFYRKNFEEVMEELNMQYNCIKIIGPNECAVIINNNGNILTAISKFDRIEYYLESENGHYHSIELFKINEEDKEEMHEFIEFNNSKYIKGPSKSDTIIQDLKCSRISITKPCDFCEEIGFEYITTEFTEHLNVNKYTCLFPSFESLCRGTIVYSEKTQNGIKMKIGITKIKRDIDTSIYLKKDISRFKKIPIQEFYSMDF